MGNCVALDIAGYKVIRRFWVHLKGGGRLHSVPREGHGEAMGLSTLATMMVNPVVESNMRNRRLINKIRSKAILN